MCVDATTRAATDYGFECRIVQDACATRSLKLDDQVVSAKDVHAAFLAALNGALWASDDRGCYDARFAQGFTLTQISAAQFTPSDGI